MKQLPSLPTRVEDDKAQNTDERTTRKSRRLTALPVPKQPPTEPIENPFTPVGMDSDPPSTPPAIPLEPAPVRKPA